MFIKNMNYEDTCIKDIEMIILTGGTIVHEEKGRNNYDLLDKLFDEVMKNKFIVLSKCLGNVVDLFLLRSKRDDKVYHVCFCEKYFKSIRIKDDEVEIYLECLNLDNALLSCEICEKMFSK